MGRGCGSSERYSCYPWKRIGRARPGHDGCLGGDLVLGVPCSLPGNIHTISWF
jgi:hypothetical protein